ncbi:hypothetical protein Vi05172_g12273 [Venturia inaequalis]|nr:hypothetical protein Vi05172_g12273 [Venturia inaequalis]
MAAQPTATDLMAFTKMMSELSMPVPTHPTHLVNNNGKRQAEDDSILSAPSRPTKKIMLQQLQETKSILTLPAKLLVFNLPELPEDLVVNIMEQINDISTLVNLIIASEVARRVFLRYPKATMSQHTSNELVINFFVDIFSLPPNQALERGFPKAITQRLIRAVCVLRSLGSEGTLDVHEFLRLALDPKIPMDESKYPIQLSALASVATTLACAVQNDEFCLETQKDSSTHYESWSWKEKVPEDRMDSLTAELFDNAFWMFQLFQDVVLYRTELRPNKEHKRVYMPSPSDIIPEVIDEITDEWKLEARKTWRDVLALRNEIYVRFIAKRRVNKVRINIEQVRRGTTLTSKEMVNFVAIDLARAQNGLGILPARDVFTFNKSPRFVAISDYWWTAIKEWGRVTRSPRWKERFLSYEGTTKWCAIVTTDECEL